MPRAQDATTWTPQLKRKNPASAGPVIWTRADRRDGSRPVDVVPSGPDLPQGVLLQESFDGLPDYSSDDPLPPEFGPWDEKRQGQYEWWSPGTGHPDRYPAFMITGQNPEWLRDGTGKAFVAHRESYTGSGTIFNSDGILSSATFTPSPRLYIRFYIKFQPGWTEAGQSKLFRVSSYDGGPRFGFGSSETDSHAPLFFWDYGHGGQFGVRNFLSLRGAPNTSNYFWAETGNPPNLPRNMNNGDVTCNFGVNVTSPGGGHTNPPYISKVTGSPVGDVASHADIYGTDWNKIEFYLEMNSAPGMADGVLRQRINGIETFRNLTMPWVSASGPANKLWNHIALGGNDNFTEYPNEDRAEEWYAIEDLLVATDRLGDWA